jgi:hypothetical protein
MLLIPTLLCPKSWEGMPGNDTERFCTHCQKKVHNLEALSVSERLALLSSPAAKLCSRYQAAIRRPRKAYRESYALHLVKYGAGVAVAGSALVVLWEMHEQGMPRPSHYRAVTPGWSCGLGPEMPDEYYEEVQGVFLGGIGAADFPRPVLPQGREAARALAHVDVQIDHEEITHLFEQLKAPALARLPLKK